MAKVLNIVCDDLFAYRDFVKNGGRFGDAPFGVVLNTPNLDRLAARSTTFHRASAIIAVCMPSRAAVGSMLSPAETGIFSNNPYLNAVLLPEQLWTYELRRAGYYMGTVGKEYHVQDDGYLALPAIFYERMYHNAPFSYPKAPSVAATSVYPGVEGGGRGWVGQDAGFYDYRVASDTITHLRRTDLPANWYWCCGFKAPHEPFHWPQRCFDAIPLDSIVEPEDWPLSWDLLPFTRNEVGDANAGLINEGFHEYSPSPSTWTTSQRTNWKHSVRNYLAGVLYLDEQLGRVLDAAEARPDASQIITLLWADHGYHLGDKGRFHKFTLWDEACNAACMVSVPGQTSARDVHDCVSLLDLGATVLDYAGLPLREGWRGVSMRPYIEGGSTPDRMVLSFFYGSVSGSVGLRRITFYQDGQYEFYNLATDPWAANNLAPAGGPEFEAMREQLHREARSWGLLTVEEGAAILPGSPLATLIGYQPRVSGPLTTDFIAMGDLDVRAESPNYKRMYQYNRTGVSSKTIHMPEGVAEFANLNTIHDITIFGNGMNNTISLRQTNKFNASATIYGGEGDDVIDKIDRRIIAYGGPGNDFMRSSGANSQYYGGEGDDEIRSTGGGQIWGGPGNDRIFGGGNVETVYAESGFDTIDTGGGDDRIIITGGSHTVTLGSGSDTVVVHRTGQLQTINDMTASDTLDLSAWAPIQPVRVRQVGADVEVIAGLERILCKNATAATVASRVMGATVA